MGPGGNPDVRERLHPTALDEGAAAVLAARLDSYRRLADVFHDVLAEQSLEAVLERIAHALAELIPHDTLTVYEAEEKERRLVPVLARDDYAAEIMGSLGPRFGEGLTGWAVEHRQAVLANDAHLDPRVVFVPGTPADPEALITVPLIARDSVKGALNIYRTGADAAFSEEELELAKRFGDAAALALDNAHGRASLEQLVHIDSLTGLYNHRFFQERLRAELLRAGRTGDSISVLMLDIDDFKRLNDIHGHGMGDQVLAEISKMLRETVRRSDVVCRLGGEEMAVIMPSCDTAAAVGLADRVRERLASTDFGVGRISLSVGVANGPEHASNPRELVWCAEAAMMTAKAQGKDRVVVYQTETLQRPSDQDGSDSRDVRSIAHLKMLQSLAGKLNRLNNVHDIAMTIAAELRTLIDYHNCRVYVADGRELVPVALMAAYEEEDPRHLRCEFGEGITGRAAANNESLLIHNALECDFAITIPDTEDVPESLVAVPLTFGSRVIGVIVLSSLGVGQFDEDDVRLMEVLAGNASVALENARLYEAQRREAHTAKALLEFSDAMTSAPSREDVARETTEISARLLDATRSALWMQEDGNGDFCCLAHSKVVGGSDEPAVEVVARADAEWLLAGRDGPFVIKDDSVRTGGWHRGQEENGTVAIAPLNGIAGWIGVGLDGDDGLPEEGLRLLSGIAHQASVALQKVKFYEEQRQNAEMAQALLDFGRELSGAEGLDSVVRLVAERSARILDAQRTAVWLEEPETGDFVVAGWAGYEEAGFEAPIGMRIPSDVARSHLTLEGPFVVGPEEAAAIIPRILGRPDGPTHFLYAIAPFLLDGGSVGAVMAISPVTGERRLTDAKVRLLDGIAQQAKLAISSAANNETLERTFMSTVEALANALEAKDEYTSTHARDITDMALKVGRELGLDEGALKRLELASLFHDIGKIGIPTQILLKPGRLSEVERAVVQTYPDLGDRILAPIARLEDVRPIVRACHERFDGHGYPEGRGGEEIPIEARIIFVCDAYDAMLTDRPYREALTADEASARLVAASGTQFDPTVVQAFLRVVSA